jgi:HEAT repeat protein
LSTASNADNPLTGLPGNRAVRRELQASVIENHGIAAFFDIQGFKPFNDHYGLALGDSVIRRLGGILTEILSPDFVGHVGGDDFVSVGMDADFVRRVQRAELEFRLLAPGFYSNRDRDAGGIETFDRYGSYRFFPFLDLTVVMVTADGSGETVETLCEKAGREKARLRGVPVPEQLSPLFSRDCFSEMPESDGKALLEAMGILRQSQAVPLVRDVLQGGYGWNLRKSAALSLGRIGGEEAVAALLAALSDTSPHVRTRAVEGLVLAAGRNSGPMIASLAGDSSTWVRRAVLRGIGMAGWQPGLDILLEAVHKNRHRRIDTIAERTAALEGIAMLGTPAAAPVLSELCRDSRYEPGGQAFRALCAVGGDNAVEEVLRRGILPDSIRLEGTSDGNLTRLEELAVSVLDRKALRVLSVFPRELSRSTRSALRKMLGAAGGELFLQLVELLESGMISGDTSCAARVAARLSAGDTSLEPHAVCRFLIWLSRTGSVPPGVFLKPFLRTASGQVRLAAATALSMQAGVLTTECSETSFQDSGG